MADCCDRSIVNNEIQALEYNTFDNSDRNTDVCKDSTSYSIQLQLYIVLSGISDDGDTDVIPDTNTQLAIT